MPVQNGQEVGTKDGGLIIPMQRRAELRLNREEKVRLSNLRAPLDAEGADQMVVQPLFGLRLMQVELPLPLRTVKPGKDHNGVVVTTVLIFILTAKERKEELSLAVYRIKTSLTDVLLMITKDGGNPMRRIGTVTVGTDQVLLPPTPLLPHKATGSRTSTGSGRMLPEAGHCPKKEATEVGKETGEVRSIRKMRLGTGIAEEVVDRGRGDRSDFGRRGAFRSSVCVLALCSLIRLRIIYFSHARI